MPDIGTNGRLVRLRRIDACSTDAIDEGESERKEDDSCQRDAHFLESSRIELNISQSNPVGTRVRSKESARAATVEAEHGNRQRLVSKSP